MKHYQPAKPGTKLAGYNVLAEIGRGAASVIYLVQEPKTKQVRALKHVQKSSAKDQRFIIQAEREYEIAQKVRHPLIREIERMIKGRQRLLTVNEVFLLMEYVDGVSVEQHPPASLEQAMPIFVQTARALDHMHNCGYVHADMKPNNVVVTDDGTVKIIDLGQACPIGTVKERIQGTPDYIAPEQVHRREITPLTDVYNMGATIYWCVTQQHIPTALPKDNSLVSTLDDQFIERPTPPSEINPRVPALLSDLAMHCVEVNPEDRPGSMADVAERLEAIHAEMQDAGAGEAGANQASGERHSQTG